MADNKATPVQAAPRRGVPVWAFLALFAGAALAGSAALLHYMNSETKLSGPKPFAQKP